jgi:hypothetical protein
MPADRSDAEALRALVLGYRATFLIRAMADLGVADLLAGGSRDAAELAAEANCNADALRRVLFALAQLGLVTRERDGRYGLTERGACLRSDHPEKVRAFARYQGHDFIQRSWAGLTRSIRTGETAFDAAFGSPTFDYLEENPDIAALFTAGMAAHTQQHLDAIVSAYDWSGLRTIVDVGGADGLLMAAILAAAPAASGVVFDQPRAECPATRRIAAEKLEARCRFVGGDFFEAVPADGDAYLLKYILHDWNDERAAAILTTVRRATGPNSRLIVIERLVPEDGTPALDTAMLDVAMLVVTGGRERTASEFRELFDRTGFRLTRVVPTASPFSLIEGEPV